MEVNNPNDNPGVRIPPPLIFLGFLIIGLWYDSPWFEGYLTDIKLLIMGGIIVVLGGTFILKSAPRHKEVGSNVEPWKPTTIIITNGVYAYTRNPIYLGMLIVHGGLAIAAAIISALITFAISICAIQFYVIAREESYLDSKFGDTYKACKAKVRRWI